MADLRGCFETTDEPSSGAEVLPEGTYTVKIVSAYWKDTKNKDGQFLQVNMEVIEGQHKGAVIIDRLNLKNRSEMAVQIARSQFAALRRAVGVLDPKDSYELVGPRFQLYLKCEKRKDEPDKMTNRVQRYIEKGQAVAAPQQAQDDAPWSRNAPKQEAAAGSEVPF